MCFALLCVGCAAGASSIPHPAEADSPDVTWGDEYAGIAEDTDLEDALADDSYRSDRTGASLDVLAQPPNDTNEWLRSVAANVRYRHAASRFRQSSYGRAGAVEVFDVGPIRHVTVGAIRPTIGEGALVADARDLGSPIVRASPSSMLRVASSSSLWGSVLGGGAEVGVGGARVGVAAWRPHDDDTTWTAWSALEWRTSRTQVGAAYGRTTDRHSGALALQAAHWFRPAFVSIEVGARACAARVVAGNAWRAAFALGAPAASDIPVGAGQRVRRMAVLERRDLWRGISSKVVASSLARSHENDDERRRRVDWTLRARVEEGAQIEAGVRFTETETWTMPSPLARGENAYATEWRARVALVVREHPTAATEVEHMFRLDTIHEGASTGVAGTWRGSIRRGWLDCRAQASAWGLAPGQLGYLGRGGLPGSGAFTTVSRSGSDLTAAVRAHLGGIAAVGAEWRRNASGDTGILVGASLSW